MAHPTKTSLRSRSILSQSWRLLVGVAFIVAALLSGVLVARAGHTQFAETCLADKPESRL